MKKFLMVLAILVLAVAPVQACNNVMGFGLYAPQQGFYQQQQSYGVSNLYAVPAPAAFPVFVNQPPSFTIINNNNNNAGGVVRGRAAIRGMNQGFSTQGFSTGAAFTGQGFSILNNNNNAGGGGMGVLFENQGVQGMGSVGVGVPGGLQINTFVGGRRSFRGFR